MERIRPREVRANAASETYSALRLAAAPAGREQGEGLPPMPAALTRVRGWLPGAALLSIALLAGLATLATLIDLPDPMGWIADLLVHWQWAYLCAALAGAATCAWLERSRGWMGVAGAAVCTAVCAASFMQAAPVLPDSSEPVPALKVASANLFYGNHEMARLVQWIRAESPEIVVLQEVSPAAAAQLRSLSDYPNLLIDAAPGPFALAVLSRLPIDVVEVVQGPMDLPGQGLSYRVELSWSGRRIALAALHLAAPTTPTYRRQRDALLGRTAEWAARSGIPVIAAGDLNSTPWSRAFKQAADLGLRRATGLTPTWPSVLGPETTIPIDHVLASRHWAVAGRSRGPDIGSDHRPVLVALTLRPSARPPG
jgi:endonuclease/exonuclease/phosphatase (EEP) superfamily protein YafD